MTNSRASVSARWKQHLDDSARWAKRKRKKITATATREDELALIEAHIAKRGVTRVPEVEREEANAMDAKPRVMEGWR